MKKFLVAFESGHYKEIEGKWLGDRVWGHFQRLDSDGNVKSEIHINKDKVEYIEVREG